MKCKSLMLGQKLPCPHLVYLRFQTIHDVKPLNPHEGRGHTRAYRSWLRVVGGVYRELVARQSQQYFFLTNWYNWSVPTCDDVTKSWKCCPLFNIYDSTSVPFWAFGERCWFWIDTSPNAWPQPNSSCIKIKCTQAVILQRTTFRVSLSKALHWWQQSAPDAPCQESG